MFVAKHCFSCLALVSLVEKALHDSLFLLKWMHPVRVMSEMRDTINGTVVKIGYITNEIWKIWHVSEKLLLLRCYPKLLPRWNYYIVQIEFISKVSLTFQTFVVKTIMLCRLQCLDEDGKDLKYPAFILEYTKNRYVPISIRFSNKLSPNLVRTNAKREVWITTNQILVQCYETFFFWNYQGLNFPMAVVDVKMI